jgi:hypothetical protein
MLTRQVWIYSLILAATVAGCSRPQGRPGSKKDEAMLAGRTPASLAPPLNERVDYFHDMDGGKNLTDAEVRGRNMWLVWTGGNDRFWDSIGVDSFGTLDYLKTLSSHPSMQYGRRNRFDYLGLINEPCFREATGPDPNRFGLWLDVRDPNCPPDPFADAEKYKGVRIGARGKTVPVGSYYGEPSGIVGFRLFPNPAFDEKARRRWDSERYYRDESYYVSKDLIRPYRVGMSCAFCHVGPNPNKPPADPENPRWENLSSNVGAQYFWTHRIFNWRGDRYPQSYFYQLFRTYRPGALDTSLVSSDSINNPRTMNAVYELAPRMAEAKKFGMERLAGAQLNNKQFNDFTDPSDPLAQFFEKPDKVWTPRVLKDGSDSVGALGALNRVYINIGLFSEEWLLHFRPLFGGTPITPIEIAVAQRNSAYWVATEQQTMDMARFFLATTEPHRLKDAPGHEAYLTEDAATLERGKIVFAERCARCHSSKLPELPPEIHIGQPDCMGAGYLRCWDQYWAWTKTDDFKTKMRAIVLAPDFTEGNYLSNELRVPVTLLETNACSPLATNAIRGNIWDNFSSETYKQLPSAGKITVRHPVTAAERDFVLPGGGRGFTRPASLASLWSTAPFLLNNSVGRFEPSPAVDARMRSFQDSIEQMLWPERRPKDPIFGAENGPSVGVIDRTTAQSAIFVPAGYVPDPLRPLLGLFQRLLPFLFDEGGSVTIARIPKGTAVNLLANLDLVNEDAVSPEARKAHFKEMLQLLDNAIRDLKRGVNPFADAQFVERMLKLNKCPDFVVNKGHYFGTDYFKEEPGLNDAAKRDLIAFLKTL